MERELIPFFVPGEIVQPTHLKHEWNKGTESSLLATTDRDALTQWIVEHGKKSKHTENSYIREANRFLLWLEDVMHKSICDLSREDVTRYKDFLASPPPSWCGKKVGYNEENWKPFYSQSPNLSSVAQSFGIVITMLTWLQSVGYIKINPAAKLPRERSVSSWEDRVISSDMRETLIWHLEQLPRETDHQKRRYHRLRWVFVLLSYTGIRISELQKGKMSQFKVQSGKGVDRVFLQITGKGNKKRKIPVDEYVLEELGIYRLSLGMEKEVQFGEDTYLVCSINPKRKSEASITRQALHCMITSFVSEVVNKLHEDGDSGKANLLTNTTAHWFRHTYASELLNSGADLRTARDNLGHSNVSITSRYSHSNDESRHDDTQKLFKYRR